MLVLAFHSCAVFVGASGISYKVIRTFLAYNGLLIARQLLVHFLLIWLAFLCFAHSGIILILELIGWTVEALSVTGDEFGRAAIF